MGRFGVKITLTEQAYNNLKRAKELLGASSWEDFSAKVLKLVEQSGVEWSRVEQSASRRGSGVEQSGVEHSTAPPHLSPLGGVEETSIPSEQVGVEVDMQGSASTHILASTVEEVGETGVDAGVSASAETPEEARAPPTPRAEGLGTGQAVKLGICKHQRFMDKLGVSVWCAKLRRFMSPKYCRICPERERGEGVSEAAAAAV